MNRICRTALAAAVVLQAATPVLADTGEMEAAQARWEAAFAAGDGAAAAADVFTEDARLLPPGAPVVEGREAIAAYWQGGWDAGVKDLKLGLIAVDRPSDDTMIETGSWTVTVPTEDGSTMEVSGKALVIWKKEADGVWRMAQDMWNGDS